MILYYLIAMAFSIIGCSNPEPEDYQIPQGFKGQVNIIFNRKDGTPTKYENGRRIYEIPTSGILLTQFKDEYGWVNHRYYYVDKSGERISLKIFKEGTFIDSSSKINRDEIGIFFDGTIGQYGNDNDPRMAKYQYFVVSSYNGLDTFFTDEYKRKFDDKIEKVTGLTLNLK